MSLINLNERFKDRSIKYALLSVTLLFLLVLTTFSTIALLKIKNNEHVRVAGFEFNIPRRQVYNTETILYKSDTVIKKETILLDKPESSSVVIDAKNVNTGSNNGIIGDYGTIYRTEQRHLDETLKNQLVMKIDRFLADYQLDKSIPIVLCFPLGDNEARIFTSEVKHFLSSKSYNILAIEMGSRSAIMGFVISQSKYWQNDVDCVTINLGSIDTGLGKL